jgi:hypothetical protein
MCHMLPFALYSDIQNLLVSASAIRHCASLLIFPRAPPCKYLLPGALCSSVSSYSVSVSDESEGEFEASRAPATAGGKTLGICRPTMYSRFYFSSSALSNSPYPTTRLRGRARPRDREAFLAASRAARRGRPSWTCASTSAT